MGQVAYPWWREKSQRKVHKSSKTLYILLQEKSNQDMIAGWAHIIPVLHAQDCDAVCIQRRNGSSKLQRSLKGKKIGLQKSRINDQTSTKKASRSPTDRELPESLTKTLFYQMIHKQMANNLCFVIITIPTANKKTLIES